MADYEPRMDENGVGFCAFEDCPQYDGKRCRLMGFRPDDNSICEPWAIAAARDKRAMDAMRKVLDADLSVTLSKKSLECDDPADAILTAAEQETKGDE